MPPISIISVFLLLSGFASLAYQVVWVRLIGLSLGSTAASISIVLTAFFLGLALGSYLTDRITQRGVNSFWPYIILEIIIGAFGFLSLPVLLNLDLLLSLAPAFGDSLWLKFLLSVVLLLVPTTAMGATFPVMAAIMVRQSRSMGASISRLYGFNTAGAVLGAAATGFYLIPNAGLDGAILVAVVANGAVALFAFILTSIVELPPMAEQDSAGVAEDTEQGLTFKIRFAGVILMATGFVSIATQIGWTKYLAIFTGSTIYGFSAILASFLVGVALGSIAIERIIDKISKPDRVIAWCLVVLAATLFFTRGGLGQLPLIQSILNSAEVDHATNEQIRYAVVFALVFLPTFVLGALFPVNLKLFCGTLERVRSRIGLAYALNTVAGIAGSIFAGFVVIPLFGTDVLLTGLAYGVLLLSLSWMVLNSDVGDRRGLVSTVLIVFAASLFIPHLNFQQMIATVGYDRDDKGRDAQFHFLEEGKAGVISLSTFGGRYLALQNNGLNESSYDLEDRFYTLRIEALLGTLPYLLHPDPKDAFVVGYGAGHTVTALTRTDIDTIKVVELEPAVVRASRSMKELPNQTLDDGRITLEFNDARNSLLVSADRYDLIVSQPSHPWVAGASNVFTREFWQIASSRLTPNGVFGQWINLFGMDRDTLKSVMKAFYQVFPHGFTIIDGQDMIMIGTRLPLKIDVDQVNEFLQRADIVATLGREGVTDWRDLAWYFGLSRAEAVEATQDGIANTDTNLFTEVRLSGRFRSLNPDEDPVNFLNQFKRTSVVGFLPSDRSDELLLDLGGYFVDKAKPNRVAFIRNQLTDKSTIAADDLLYQSLYLRRQLSYQILAFDKKDTWSDATRTAHVDALSRAGLFAQALTAANGFSSPAIRAEQIAKVHVRSGNIAALSAMDPNSFSDPFWYDLGLAHGDVLSRAPELLARENVPDDAALDLAQLAYRHAAARDERALFAGAARTLRDLVAAELKQLEEMGQFALQVDDRETAARVGLQMEMLDPEAKLTQRFLAAMN